MESAWEANDSTATRTSEAALEPVQRELIHATRLMALGELAASIAHEVSQPLAAIVADASAGLNWLNGSAPNLLAVRESLEAITREGARAGEIVSRVRDLVERTPREPSTCDVSNVVEGVLPFLRERLQRARIVLQPLLASDLPSVMADPVELQQVLLNLVLNAVDALEASAAERRFITVRSVAERRVEGRWVVVSVEDRGPGIAAADASRLFTPFYTTKPGGLGLGLSISRSILARHGGSLWAEQNAGPGAVFRFALPAA